MNGYRVDFEMGKGHEMIIDRDGGFTRGDLDELELQMLHAAPIPGLLDVEWLEIDDRITFRYLLTGRRMLTGRLQHSSFTMNDYYALLLAVVEVLDNCKHYMLRAEGVVLHENYIFVGTEWEDIGLVYMPLREGASFRSLKDALLSLAVRWTAHIERVDGAGLQKILHVLEKTEGSAAAMKDLLLTLLAGGFAAYDEKGEMSRHSSLEAGASPMPLSDEGRKPGRHDHGSLPNITNNNSAPTMDNGEYDVSAASNRLLQQSEVYNREGDGGSSTNIKGKAVFDVSSAEDRQRSSRADWIAISIAITVSAAVWRYLYLDNRSTSHLILSIGITLIVFGTVFVIRQKWKGSQSDEEEVLAGDSLPSTDARRWTSDPLEGGEDWRWNKQPLETSAGGETGSSSAWKTSQVSSESREAAAAAPGLQHFDDEEGEPPIQQDRTVLLSPKQMEDNNEHHTDRAVDRRQVRYSLERVAAGVAQNLPLSEGKTIIGRAAESADYVDNEAGLSRAHLELKVDKTGCSVKDLGSRNGSWLQGQLMVPYKKYVLQIGDEFQLAGAQGPTYRLGEKREVEAVDSKFVKVDRTQKNRSRERLNVL
ncbi:FHA domain-containing protein [Paenibacillaceae bacterium]|nr:FHA domain-containing protein [Paenibacillaceae bacterium]